MPKRDIPDGWANNGRCPACGAAGLKVTHMLDMADYLSCAKCEISFEVENGGRYVRVKYLPDALEFDCEHTGSRILKSAEKCKDVPDSHSMRQKAGECSDGLLSALSLSKGFRCSYHILNFTNV